MIPRLIATTLMASALVGCSGKILDYTNASDGCSKGVCSGVHYYRLKWHTFYYYQDRILDGDGKIIRFAGGSDTEACIPIITAESKLIPESDPSLIAYDPGPFEDSKFSVELGDQGNLKSVGVETTSGAKAAIEAVSTIASTAKVLKADAGILAGTTPPAWVSPDQQPIPPMPYCNSGNIVTTDPNPLTPPPEKDKNGCHLTPTGKVCDR